MRLGRNGFRAAVGIPVGMAFNTRRTVAAGTDVPAQGSRQ